MAFRFGGDDDDDDDDVDGGAYDDDDPSYGDRPHSDTGDSYDDADDVHYKRSYCQQPASDASPPSTSFCEHVSDYPAAHIERQLAADPERFAALQLADGELPPAAPQLAVRFGDDSGDNNVEARPLCASRESIIYPRMGQTARNTWMYIVNSRRYQQGIRVEMCASGGGDACAWPGGGRSGALPFGMRAVCKQKFTFRQLLAVDAYGRPKMEAFRMPCCCSCVLVQNERMRF